MGIKFRKHFDYDVEAASNETAYVETMASLTVQSQMEDADINVLMERFGITGKMPENPVVPQYGDFTQVGDYRSALHAVMKAEEDFMALPARVRARFDNDPQRLLEFVHDDANIAEARSLGLLKEVAHGGGSGDTGTNPAVGAHGGASGGVAGGDPAAPGGVAAAAGAPVAPAVGGRPGGVAGR